VETATFKFALVSVGPNVVEVRDVRAEGQDDFLVTTDLFEVGIDLFKSENLSKLDHLIVPFLLLSVSIDSLFTDQVNSRTDGVTPVSLGVADYRGRVRRPVLQVSGLILGFRMPREELAKEMNVLVDFFIQRDCNV
jgi:hypothetical protein